MQRLDRCTAQLHAGRFCDAPSIEDAPFPICQLHAFKTWARVNQLMRAERTREGMERYATRVREGNPLVYYIDQGERVKIGFTQNIQARMTDLMAKREEVLAVEPGSLDLERARHVQFAHCRIDDREFFTKSPELMAHIAATRTAFGFENLAPWV